MNVNYYNVYSVIRIQLCTWTTNLQSTVASGVCVWGGGGGGAFQGVYAPSPGQVTDIYTANYRFLWIDLALKSYNLLLNRFHPVSPRVSSLNIYRRSGTRESFETKCISMKGHHSTNIKEITPVFIELILHTTTKQ